MKLIPENRMLIVVAGVALGLIAGWLLFHNQADPVITDQTESTSESIWTCAMHPQIRQHEPGDCPICGMELIKLNGLSSGQNVVEMSWEAAKLANIQTSVIQFALPEKEIFLQGKVKMDERKVRNQTSHIDGRIDKLFISFTGESVKLGQKLASIYSPELVTAQKELFEAIKTKESNPRLYSAAKNKLRQWKLSDAQIDAIESKGEVQENLDIHADVSGVVLKRNVSVGDHVKEGSVLFVVVDLSTVWVEFEAYEADIPWLKVGDKINFTVLSLPGKHFDHNITFIDPIINSQTRTAAVRLEVPNKNGDLKPEMFTNGLITAKLPIDEAQITVPKSAVMWTGKRSVVYVVLPESDKPLFEFREVSLGADLGGYFIVAQGLSEGEKVVTNGAFKVDAAAQLAGKNSMMNNKTMLPPDQENSNSAEADELQAGQAEMEFRVSGNCVMCKARIEKAALQVKGVTFANWNKETKMIKLYYDPEKADKEATQRAIVAAGHDTEFDTSADAVYDSLPACCQYTREKSAHKH